MNLVQPGECRGFDRGLDHFAGLQLKRSPMLDRFAQRRKPACWFERSEEMLLVPGIVRPSTEQLPVAEDGKQRRIESEGEAQLVPQVDQSKPAGRQVF